MYSMNDTVPHTTCAHTQHYATHATDAYTDIHRQGRGTHAGLVGEYAGLVGEYAGDVGE